MIYLTNSTFLPCNGLWKMTTVDLEFAQELVKSPFTSAVGHSSTAEIMSTLLHVEVPVNRISLYELEVGTQLLCFKLKERAPEGVILSKEEIETIGYEWKLLALCQP